MCKEHIRCVSRWRHGLARYDTVLVKAPETTTMSGFTVARVCLFFRFEYGGVSHSCALVHDYSMCGLEPDADTGMWIVSHALLENCWPHAWVIPISDILCAVHLIPVFFDLPPLSKNLKHTECLDYCQFCRFYVNWFIDHHAFEILS